MKRFALSSAAALLLAGCATTGPYYAAPYYAPPAVAVAPGPPVYAPGWGPPPASSLWFSWSTGPSWRGGPYGHWHGPGPAYRPWGPSYRPWGGPPPRHGAWGPAYGPKPYVGPRGFGRKW